MPNKQKGGGKGGRGRPTQAYQPPRSHMLTAVEKDTLSQLAEKAAYEAEMEKERQLLAKLEKRMRKKTKSKDQSSSSSASDDDDVDDYDNSDQSDDDDDALTKKKRGRPKQKKKDKSKKKASSSDGEGSSSKGTSNSKSKKKKASKLCRVHQELKGVKEDAAVAKKHNDELHKEILERFEKLQSSLLEGKSVLHTPDKARPITKDDLVLVVAEAGKAATEKAEASRPRRGLLAWIEEHQSTPTSATNPPSTTPSKQVTNITAVMRQWLDDTADDTEKYTPLGEKNPTLESTGLTFCANIAKKVSSWYTTPEDINLLKKIINDYKLQTAAASSSGLIKAILVALLARGYDLDPEKLYVAKSDIMAMMK
jgi:hypothetical protein